MLELPELLQQCTVLVKAGQSKTGTGFYLRPNIILTCNHVINHSSDNNMNIEVITQDNSVIKATILSNSKEYDLALLYVSRIDSSYVVVNDNLEIGDQLYAFGYPSTKFRAYGNYSKGDSITLDFEGFSYEPLLMKLKNGQVVSGFSGAPLLNLRTGGVCGIVKLSRGESQDIGGRAVPISNALDCFNNILQQQEVFNKENKKWFSLIESESSTPKNINSSSTIIINNKKKVLDQTNIRHVENLTINK